MVHKVRKGMPFLTEGLNPSAYVRLVTEGVDAGP